ncbi:hypothetical protein UlMin_022774 [Ulmus minor]
MDPIVSFLRDGTLPADKFEACRLRFRSARYFLDKGKLYKKGFSSPSLLCLDEDQGKFTLEECQCFSAIPRQAPEDLTTITSPWPFSKWGIDLIGHLPTACEQLKYALVSDHGTQFENEKLQSICDRLGIKKMFSSPAHPKSNGQVEAVNKTIKQTLKKKLEKSKGAWVDELPLVLWSYRTSF